MLKNPVKEKLLRGEAVIGAFAGTSDARIVEICGNAGFDYVLLDSEHTPYSFREIENLVRAAELSGMPSFVRVPANSPEAIGKVLDVGAWGVMIPQVHNQAEAQRAVDAVKYHPFGHRGASVPRVAGFGSKMGFREWTELSNQETMVIVQIENREAVDNLAEILAVSEIDAFELGQADLSQSLGSPGATGDPLVKEYLSRAVKTILDAGRVLGDTTSTGSDARRLVNSGYRMVSCSLNKLILEGGRAFVNGTRGLDGGAH